MVKRQGPDDRLSDGGQRVSQEVNDFWKLLTGLWDSKFRLRLWMGRIVQLFILAVLATFGAFLLALSQI